MFDAIRDQIAQMGLSKPDGFNSFAAGNKQYGIEGRSNATSGPIGPDGMQGYQQRDQEQAAKRQAVLNRMQAAQTGNYMSANYLRGTTPT